MNIIGNIEGKNVILVDDMIDTAGTISNAADALVERGAKKYLHAVLILCFQVLLLKELKALLFLS